MRHSLRDQGSIAITVTVSMVATALTAALLTVVFRDLHVTRRAGDSANALQVADAGVNEAVKAVATAAGTTGTCPEYPLLPGFTRTNTIASGTYTYCAAKEEDSLGRVVWHIDATGTDKSGAERRIRASALSEPRFPNAIQVLATATFNAGFIVDSYKDELNRCTKKGRIGTNDPENFSFGTNGQGNSVANCQNVPTGVWPHPADGCIAYSRNGDAVIPASQIGSGKCPPAPYTTTDSPEFSVPTPVPPSYWDYPASSSPGANFTCNSVSLQPGKVYYFSSVTLNVGCGIVSTGLAYPAMETPVKIYTHALTVGGSNGSGLNPINEPPNSATVCGSTHGQVGANRLYCPGWPGALQIDVIGNGSVTFSGNHGTFWGTIRAPQATATWGGGSPQWEIFGSMISASVGGDGGKGGVQAKWHYDETLGKLTTGRHFLQTWREEAQR